MSRPRSATFSSAAITIAVIAAASLSSPAGGQTSTSPSSSDSTSVSPGKVADSAANAATDSSHRSRFGRWGKALGHAASKVGKATGIDKQTAERMALTVATGGVGAALMNTKAASTVPGVAGLANGLNRESALIAAMHSTPNGSSASGAAAGDSALSADQDLAQIATRAAQGDSAAGHAMQSLDAAMAHPDSKMTALQHAAQNGDANAARELILYEDRIARAALAGSAQ